MNTASPTSESDGRLDTPVAPPDPASAAAMWAAYIDAADTTGEPDDVYAFGDSVAQADRLAGLILTGPKRATVGMVADYGADEVLPRVGCRSIFTRGDGTAAGVLITTEVRVGPFSSADDAFAWDEGEGDRSLAQWRTGHEAYFRRRCAALGLVFSEGIELSFERFELAWPAPVVPHLGLT